MKANCLLTLILFILTASAQAQLFGAGAGSTRSSSSNGGSNFSLNTVTQGCSNRPHNDEAKFEFGETVRVSQLVATMNECAEEQALIYTEFYTECDNQCTLGDDVDYCEGYVEQPGQVCNSICNHDFCNVTANMTYICRCAINDASSKR